MWLGIHEELHRLIVRSRWINWFDRAHAGKHTRRRLEKIAKRYERLSLRLTMAKPTWEEREGHKGRYDGAVP
jgi:hypothetical protein